MTWFGKNQINKKQIFVVAAIIAIGIIYFLIDPSAVGFMPRCIFHELTGWKCPGCGSQRMIHALLHADVVSAWHHNPLLLILFPFLLPLIYIELNATRYQAIYMKLHSVPVIVALSIIIVGWGILRNILL